MRRGAAATDTRELQLSEILLPVYDRAQEDDRPGGRARPRRHLARRRQLRRPGPAGLRGRQCRERRRSRLGPGQCHHPRPARPDRRAAGRAGLGPDRQRRRRPHLPGPRPARAGRGRRGAIARRCARPSSSSSSSARPAATCATCAGRRSSTSGSDPAGRARAAGCAPRACTPTSGWASISCSTRRSCAASPPPRAIWRRHGAGDRPGPRRADPGPPGCRGRAPGGGRARPALRAASARAGGAERRRG